MAAVASTNASGASTHFVVTETALTAADTLAYVAGSGQVLKLRNPTGAPIIITIKGTAPVSPSVAGTGTVFDVSAGKVITVAAGATSAVNLDKISAFLGGNAAAVTVTGGTGAFSSLLA